MRELDWRRVNVSHLMCGFGFQIAMVARVRLWLGRLREGEREREGESTMEVPFGAELS